MIRPNHKKPNRKFLYATFFIISVIITSLFIPAYSLELFKKKEKPYIIISSSPNIDENNVYEKAALNSVFEIGERIYFYVYNPQGFKSDYIKYQIVKQDDNAHIGGYSRARSATIKLKDRYKFCDYITLSQKGKYFIQVFDIENLHRWVVLGSFLVIEKR